MTADGRTVDHADLLRALKRAGFTVAGAGKGPTVYVWWPNEDQILYVPKDDDKVAEVVARLELAAARGRIAQTVLDALDGPHGAGLR